MSVAARFRANPRVAPALVVLLAVVAYLPSLSGGFVSDDKRFIVDNGAVHELSLARAWTYFTDPATQATFGHDIYRPLRTLGFAIDWAVSGGSPLFFRIRSLAWFVALCLLVLLLYRRLEPAGGGGAAGAAAAGAMLFAVHPVLTESVAFVSSRGDLIAAVFFVGALLLHLGDRSFLAALALVVALFGKEVAAVFPAAALLVDLHVRRRPRWWRYGVYGAIAVAFFLLWRSLVSASPGQTAAWPGGSWAANLVTTAKAFLYDAKVLLFPVDLAFDWRLPARAAIGIGDLALAAAGVAVLVLAVATGRRSRFAALFFLVTILPVSGLLWPMTVPTADRFLLLPAVGFGLWGGAALTRSRLSWVVLACFLALTVDRSLDWRSAKTLWAATNARVETPNGLSVAAWHAEQALRTARQEGRPEEARAAAEEILRLADRFEALYRESQIGKEPGALPPGPGSEILARRALALAALGRPREAIAAADASLRLDDFATAHEAASYAMEMLGDFPEAAIAAERAVARGRDSADDRRRLAGLLYRAGADAAAAGDFPAAAGYFERSVAAAPDEEAAAPARAALERLRR